MSFTSIIGPKKQVGVVIKKTLVANSVFEVDIRLSELMLFKPGQYVSVKVNEVGMRRSYSVASFEKGVVRLLVDISPGGVGSKFFEQVVVGDKVEIMGLLGNFVLDSKTALSASKIYFVATGTGIVPYLPMAKKLLAEGYKGEIELWWGVRYLSGLYWQDEIAKLKRYSNFKHIMYVSRPEKEWVGVTGRVGDNLDKAESNNSLWYLCGSANMIEEMRERLAKKGVEEEFINYEKFF